MEEENVSEKSLTSAAAFVEGGIQDACDDSCSICLEAFCDSDPSTVTSCKHEFHLQCILEWCQRSSQCPMCWQPIGLKDPSSQELLEGVEHERNIRMNPPRNTTIFHHPTLGDFELQHLPVTASESELEERIIQHLAAAAAMGRARHFARREGQRNRTSAQGRPQFLVFSTHPNGASAASPAAQREGGFPPAVMIAGPNSPFITVEDSEQLIPRISSARADQHMGTGSASSASATAASRPSSNRSPSQTSSGSQDRAGPSDLHSFSETLKSRFGTLSTRYKESITKTTRGWKEKLFTRNSQTPEQPTPEVRRESGQGIATVSEMMGHLEVSEDTRTRNIEDGSSEVPTSQPAIETSTGPSMGEHETRAPCAAAGSASN
ncbi:E3 ubiquitin-protein ligase RHF2A-like isoform X2 [Salvia miltiorrhiza]|uniref:E3 ubiquitin-protein ligase RHF2A-like isoform X2 n=1 Tax=Salvia miltiorrhiza TaxID=226208 RepID=UPI0025AB83D7|nr:E3 ubiquitin-protein ligase RHF2A-like isoform X2 [Salvia miltiorrhiza]XP_057808170.1 E3 ubiquitin-protein ligase RHF2A-like isoform X2 [Salvia miltiorrhiza]XP_057808175.1 E3 ubiquitin-protein ligase RHF2A-like isoform X2 [Salvia miltiorrhiza]